MPHVPHRRLWPAIAGALLVNAAALVALVHAPATTATLTAAEGRVHWASPAPPPSPSPTRATAGVAVPAEQVLTTLAAMSPGDLLGQGFTSLTPAPVGTTTVPTCFAGPAAVAARTLVASGPAGGITIELQALPAGAGTATVTGWVHHAADCGATRLLAGRKDQHPSSAPAGLTAALTPTSPAGTGRAPVLTQVAWSRGDLVAVMTFAPADTAGATSALADAVAHLDSRVGAALTGTCTDLSPTASDVTRNPALPGYTGYQVPRTVPVPPVPSTGPTPAPTSTAAPPSSPSPSAAPHPSLTIPAPAPVPSLAPVLAPTPGASAAAPMSYGPAPVLVDPQAFATDVTPVPDPGPAPVRPPAPPASVEYTVPQADPVGPGCGWAWTGASAPVTTADSIASGTAAATSAAIAKAATVRASAWVANLAWTRAWTVWASAQVVYQPYAAWDKARTDASAAWAKAVADYQASVAAYQAAAGTSAPAPTLSPTPAPVPTSSLSPTPSPVPTPTLPGA